jgi:hypothetical protein
MAFTWVAFDCIGISQRTIDAQLGAGWFGKIIGIATACSVAAEKRGSYELGITTPIG